MQAKDKAWEEYRDSCPALYRTEMKCFMAGWDACLEWYKQPKVSGKSKTTVQDVDCVFVTSAGCEEE
jgi:hypothetical protein